MQPVFWEAVVPVVLEEKLANDSNDNCANLSPMQKSKKRSLPSFYRSKFTKVFDTNFCFIIVVWKEEEWKETNILKTTFSLFHPCYAQC